MMSTHSIHASSSIQHRFSLFSGHDNTIVPLLLALELPVNQWPSFASRLIFELYKPLSNTRDHVFKLIYNGEDITRQLTFCPSLPDDGCNLRGLVNHYLSILPSMGKHSYADACQRLPPT